MLDHLFAMILPADFCLNKIFKTKYLLRKKKIQAVILRSIPTAWRAAVYLTPRLGSKSLYLLRGQPGQPNLNSVPSSLQPGFTKCLCACRYWRVLWLCTSSASSFCLFIYIKVGFRSCKTEMSQWGQYDPKGWSRWAVSETSFLLIPRCSAGSSPDMSSWHFRAPACLGCVTDLTSEHSVATGNVLVLPEEMGLCRCRKWLCQEARWGWWHSHPSGGWYTPVWEPTAAFIPPPASP